MATENPKPPEGAKTLGSSSNDGDQYELSPGEAITARVLTMRGVETEHGESGILTLELEDGDVVDYFCKGGAKRAFNEGEIEQGATYWIAKDVDEEEFNGTTYHPTRIAEIEEGSN